MINGTMIDTMIRFTTNNWIKSGTTYFLQPPSFPVYDISIEADGPIPVLVVKDKPLYDRRGNLVRNQRISEYRATDLDPFPGYIRQDGKTPNFWIATLLDKITDGQIAVEETIRLTIEEGVRRGLLAAPNSEPSD